MSQPERNPFGVLRVVGRMNVGGPALQILGLMQGIDGTRFVQRLITGQVEPGEADMVELRQSNVLLRRIRGLGRAPHPFDDLIALFRLRAEIRSFEPAIVHTHTTKAGVLGRIAAIASARPAHRPLLVHTYHGHLLHGYFRPILGSALAQVERTLAERTDRLIAVGQRVRDELVAAGIGRPEQFDVIAPGIPEPKILAQPAARERLAIPPNRLVVAFVARLTQIKRPDRFLTVAQLVSGRHPDALFVIAGGGPLLDELREISTRDRLPIRFLGWQSDVGAVYSAADVVVSTSDNEGMPVSLIEAGMTGTPSVTTDVGSAGEVVLDEETGLVTSLEAEDIARSVSRLLESEEMRRRLGQAAASVTKERFSVNRLVRDTERIYSELVDAWPHRRPMKRAI